MAWLASNRPLAPRRPTLFADELPQAMPRTIELPPEEAPPVAPADRLAADATVSPQLEPQGWQPLDFSKMQQRYPLLRPSL
jgi:hypothetical protein